MASKSLRKTKQTVVTKRPIGVDITTETLDAQRLQGLKDVMGGKKTYVELINEMPRWQRRIYKKMQKKGEVEDLLYKN